MVKSCLPTLIIGWGSDGRGSFPGLVLFRSVAPPLQPGVVGPFHGMGCRFPRCLRWREPIISKILVRNQWPTVPGVHYPDSSPRALH
jgi:hypothetical protein